MADFQTQDSLSVKELAAQVWARISPQQRTQKNKVAITPESIVQRLKAGNKRYMTANTPGGNISSRIRLKTSEQGQHPYAVVITCSDSRVIPEAIFSTGIGELFVIRVAGNVMGDMTLGSVIYAVEHLKSKLVIVLGHTQCGAVASTIEGGATGYVKSLTDEVELAIGNERNAYIASCLNVKRSMTKAHEALQEENLDVKVAGALYDIADGHVEWLDMV